MLSEKLLELFCLHPNKVAKQDHNIETTDLKLAGNELSLLKKESPNLIDALRGMRVVDFGCGHGAQSVALRVDADAYVLGLDTNEKAIALANKLKDKVVGSDSKLVFSAKVEKEFLSSFDVVISQNAMEHYPDPLGALRSMRELLRPGGKAFITFGPPWFAPYGSHMHYFCKLPWVNVLFPEKTVMNVRKNYRSDGAMKYEDVESGLNKMSVEKFKKIVRESGFLEECTVLRRVKGIDAFGKLPLFKEMLVNGVTSTLTNPG
ncbi:SAM-dependent methyltransferase [Natronocella acetinitrilica]|uniref:SAM-dependent methyltransferase n=1 Tax=Natronocella acetinitrilica TaxID=414046 RepID=A0AAE3G7B8_9GAMM|nr:class I SAM-dependent methyltransferase [Natronocella acetinitrilica]MCP1677160.1 SAM-dependent methyltransferase [Natronocella acetinitrilica]